MVSFFGLPDYANDGSIVVNLKEHIYYAAIHNNCEIIDFNYSWRQLGSRRFLHKELEAHD